MNTRNMWLCSNLLFLSGFQSLMACWEKNVKPTPCPGVLSLVCDMVFCPTTSGSCINRAGLKSCCIISPVCCTDGCCSTSVDPEYNLLQNRDGSFAAATSHTNSPDTSSQDTGNSLETIALSSNRPRSNSVRSAQGLLNQQEQLERAAAASLQELLLSNDNDV